jgi:glycosyltransferase involved in cell wall biosynthesis
MEKCSKEVTKNGIKNIHFSGFINQSELPTYYAAGDVLVLPSYYETWGLVLNEAMASGLPSIVSDGCGAAVDMIIDGKTGYTYPMGDIHQLGSLMKKFTGNKDLCKEMGLNAAEHVKKFSLEVTVSALKNSLNSVGER